MNMAIAPQDNVAILALSEISIKAGHNPRRFKSQKRLAEMRDSIASEGVLQPILVRPTSSGDGYWVVAGHTRYELAKEVGLSHIPALVKSLSDDEAFTAALVENAVRTDMNPMDEGLAAQRELVRCKGDVAEVLRVLGWSKKKLDSRILLSHASDAVAQALCDEQIQIGHAEIFCGMRPEKQDAALKWVLEKGVSVADLKSKIEQMTLHLDKAVFDTAGCSGCKHNTSMQSGLFDSGMAKARCLNAACFQEKVDAHFKALLDEQQEKYPAVKLDSQVAAETHTDLVIEGEGGVGTIQYGACQSCEHYGAIIKTGYGCAGEIVENQCFNLICHAEKVSAHAAALIASDKASAVAVADERVVAPGRAGVDEEPWDAGESSGEEEEAAGSATAGPVAAKVDSLPLKLIEHHHAIHRAASAAVVRQDRVLAKALAVLALMADGSIRLSKTPEGWPVSLYGTYRATALEILAQQTEERLDAMIVEMAARTVATSKSSHGNEKRPQDDTFGATAVSVLRLRQTDLTGHFTLSVEYLDLLTKGAIKTILEQSGFAAHYEKTKPKGFGKLMALKKKEILDAVKESGFDFTGYLPPHMAIQTEE